MDRNVALAVFFLFSIFADVDHVKRFRYLAGAAQQNNPTSVQVSGENKPDPNQNGAAKKPENVQPSKNSPPLDPQPLTTPDLVSPPPQNRTTDNSKTINFPNPGSSPVQNQTVNNDKTPKGVNDKDNGKNLSPPDKGKNPEHVNGTDLLNPDDKGKNTSPVKKNVYGTDLVSPSPVKGYVNGTDLVSPTVNKTDNEKHGGAKEKSIDDKSNETRNGKNGRAKEKTIGDKNNEIGNGNNGGAKEKTIDDKSNETGNQKNGEVKEKTIDDKTNETGNEKNGGAKEKTIDKSNETDNEKNGGVKDKAIGEKSIDDKSSSELVVNETCVGLHKCKDLETLIACILRFDTGSRELTVLVQNDGENTLIVNLTIPTANANPLKTLKVSKNQTQKINISLSASKNNKLILNAGNGECVLHTDRPETEEIFFIYLPSYDKLLTPINGAYFLILSVLVFGGTWACCMCRKRRWNNGVPYQELEMGLPESVSATNVETAEGWDQGWDDDWDEDNAMKSPGASHIGSISANGLTSRSLNRDGWENDWNE